MCGFVNMKTTHRLINCWIDEITFFKSYAITLPSPRHRSALRRFLSHPNCLPISIVKRLDKLSYLELRPLVNHLRAEVKIESEFPIVLRYQLLITVLTYLDENNYTAIALFKALLKDKTLYSKFWWAYLYHMVLLMSSVDLLRTSCLELTNRSETASITSAVNSGHAQLIEAIRKFIGDTADDEKLCRVCFEPRWMGSILHFGSQNIQDS